MVVTTGIVIPALEAMRDGVETHETPEFIRIAIVAVISTVMTTTMWKLFERGLE